METLCCPSVHTCDPQVSENHFLPEHEYVTFGSLLSVVFSNVRVPYSGVETFGNISLLYCSLAVL